ncbi:TetR/AcrR family transcriptional regulator [Nocardia terpenica]|uniref:TetR/AcrR family transcriptional regulator n=1 Tax=Nocardia terpenica TaxID=455432 RepID=UPI0018E06900|nr:TetR/AcrR family transcriptional regulator [Nocardia terpenica]
MRRTQQERREATIAKLFDAAIATLDELGYARASASTITARAGMSYGALFRHFPTMSEFMAAVARETVRRNIEMITDLARARGSTGVETLLTVAHEVVTHPFHNAINELTVAARTDERLRDAMRHTMADVGPAMIDTAAHIVGPELDLDAKEFATLVFILADLFDNEALQHPLRAPHPEIYERRIPLLLRMLKSLSPQADTTDR